MLKKRISGFMAIVMMFIMLFTVNVLAVEAEPAAAEAVYSYDVPEYSFERVFILPGNDIWGMARDLELGVTFRLAYAYSEGDWSEITYVAIDIDYIYLDGDYLGYDSVSYEVNDSSARRVISVNKTKCIEIVIEVDEYGEVSTYAYKK